jgi:PAS domain S-box-containing protein
MEKSAHWYIDFVNNLPVAVFRTTIEGKIVFCNRTFAKLFGYETAGEMIGLPVINLYRNKKDRGTLVLSIMQRGRITDQPVSFIRRDGVTIWCAITARAVLDDDGIVVHLDGLLRDITGEIEEREAVPSIDAAIDNRGDIILIFDLLGNIIDINPDGAEMLGFAVEEMRGRSFTDFLVPAQKEILLLCLADILKYGSEQMVFSVIDKSGSVHQVDCHTLLIKKNNRAHHIKGIAQDITSRMRRQKASANEEKLQGVLEMAGGVAHCLNQPLTIISHLVNELTGVIRSDDENFSKVVMMQSQVNRMTELTKKIANVKKYVAMDYVAGVRIVDIDKAS